MLFTLLHKVGELLQRDANGNAQRLTDDQLRQIVVLNINKRLDGQRTGVDLAKIGHQRDQCGRLHFGQGGEQDHVVDQIELGIKHAIEILHVRQVQRLTGIALKE
ncbi:hypothetical protein D3C80_1943730 [compost metagenome]